MYVSRNKKGKKTAYLPRYWLDLAQIWCRGYFWIPSPKSIIKFLCDVIFTSKWREGKIPIYRLQKVHITSLWPHLLSDFFGNRKFIFFLWRTIITPNLVWFGWREAKLQRGGRNPPPPGWECIKTPRWDRVKESLCNRISPQRNNLKWGANCAALGCC